MKYYDNHEKSYKKILNSSEILINQSSDLSLIKFLNFTFERYPLHQMNPKALVVGCGQGHSLEFLTQKGFFTTGVDISPSAIEICRKSIIESEQIFVMDATQLKFEENQFFDLILDDHCFHCIVSDEDRKNYLRGVFKYLKRNNGYFLFETMVYDKKLMFHENFILDDNKILWMKVFDKQYYDLRVFENNYYIPVKRILSSHEIENELLQQGFKIEYFFYKSDLKFMIPGNDLLSLKHAPSVLRVICSKEN